MAAHEFIYFLHYIDILNVFNQIIQSINLTMFRNTSWFLGLGLGSINLDSADSAPSTGCAYIKN